MRPKVSIRAARSRKEVDDAYEIAARIFEPTSEKARERLEEIRRCEAVSRPNDVIVAVDASKIVGMVQLFNRPVYLGFHQVPSVGLAYVCLLPEYRGAGLGGALVAKALEVVRARGGVLAIVIARRAVDGFYWKYGFVGIDAFAEMTVLASDCTGMQGEDVHCDIGFQRAQSSAYANAYTQTYRMLPFAFARDQHWWSEFPRRLSATSSEVECVNVYVNKRWRGYFLVCKKRVVEAAAARGFLRTLTSAVLSYHGSSEADGLSLALPLGHPSLLWARRCLHTLNLRFAWNGGHMIRVLNKEIFVSRFRAHYAEVMNTDREWLAQLRVGRHEEARELVFGAYGQVIAGERCFTRTLPKDVSCVLHLHPVWSAIDEF